jgi:hypothetical protein
VHYGLSPLGLSFTQANQEIDYQAVLLTATVAHIRFALLLAMIIIAAFGIVDSFIYKPSTVLFYALVIRFIIVLPAAVMLFMITFHSRYIRYVRVVGVCGICAVGLGFGLIAYSSTVLTLIYTYPAIVMTTIYAFFFVGLFFRYAIVAATLTNLIYSVAIWTTDIPEAMRIAACISMITLLLMLAMAAYQKELISRQLFISETRERESIARQRQSDHRYLTWLRQLASFLRHEVRQPVAQINSSIEIVQLACKADDHLKTISGKCRLGRTTRLEFG